MNPDPGYPDGRSLWAAASAHAKNRYPGAQTSDVLRHFVYERFLARVFAVEHSPFVLKGGTAALVRVHDARTTKDVDLMDRENDLPTALALLRQASARDLGDHLAFRVGEATETLKGANQPGVRGAHIPITVLRDGRPTLAFGVDLVVGSLMTAPAEQLRMTSILPLRGLSVPTVRLYPLVDHIADKVCATATLHGAEQGRSSRVRDLIDLVIFAKTHPVEAHALAVALHQKWAHSALPGSPTFDPPAQWARPYRTQATRTPACAGVEDFDAAAALVGAFLAPALASSPPDLTWDPASRTWGPTQSATQLDPSRQPPSAASQPLPTVSSPGRTADSTTTGPSSPAGPTQQAATAAPSPGVATTHPQNTPASRSAQDAAERAGVSAAMTMFAAPLTEQTLADAVDALHAQPSAAAAAVEPPAPTPPATTPRRP